MIVGFTIGCWDLLHYGHENHLQTALSECNLLYIGIVSDWLVKMQKGCMPAETYARRKEKLECFIETLWQKQENEDKDVRFVEIDCLHQEWISKLVDVVFAGEDQIDRFYAARCNRAENVRIVERTEGISSTLLKEILAKSNK
jgi:glycerol-3-phosphate cytidylyltransferase